MGRGLDVVHYPTGGPENVEVLGVGALEPAAGCCVATEPAGPREAVDCIIAAVVEPYVGGRDRAGDVETSGRVTAFMGQEHGLSGKDRIRRAVVAGERGTRDVLVDDL